MSTGIFNFACGNIDFTQCDIHSIFRCCIFILTKGSRYTFIQEVKNYSRFCDFTTSYDIIQQEISNQGKQGALVHRDRYSQPLQ